MTLSIPDEFTKAADLSEKDLLIELAVYLYDKGRLSIGKARRLAGLDLISFQKELAERNVYLNYDVEEFREDMKTLGLLENGSN